jgi:hypothetical protein
MNERTGIVIEEHIARSGPVLVGQAGERLRRGRVDTAWPGWIWCENGAGVGGWAPEPFLDLQEEWATLRRDYDATELTAVEGDRLSLQEEVSGWWWATGTGGVQGWIPAAKVRAGS